MSEHDDTLLDGDLGDEEYDLGNDEEEALLADDYELERQNSYKGEEETDDVLDLGVTDALDDLDAEDENIEFGRSKTDNSNENDFYEDGERQKPGNRYDQDSGNNVGDYKGGDQAGSGHTRSYEERGTTSGGDSVNVSSGLGRVDLREKLQRNVQKVYVGNGQGLEDDDCEEAKERRNRFQNERTIVSPKMNTNIPDSLENVVTPEPSRLSFRGRGRGRILRGGGGGGVRGGGGVGGGLIAGGGRFNTQTSGNFNPRFGGVRNPSFENQQPSCRPPLLETRPPFLLGLPNNVQNQQIIYQQSNPPLQPFQHYTPNNGPIPSHFVDNRQQTFQGPGPFHGQPGPRIIGPRLEYGPRTGGGGGDGRGSGSGGGAGGTGGLTGSIQGPPYGCSPGQPPYGQLQPGHFQNSLPDNHPPRLVQTNQPPLLQGNPPGASLLGNPGPLVTGGGPPAPLLPGNQGLPMQAFPRGGPPSFSQGPPGNHPNVQMPGNQQQQPPFEGRPTFQESQFEGRPVYDSRPSGYSDQPPAGQFNNGPQSLPPAPQQQQQQQQQPAPNVPNVPLAPGHKILINPHFRGAVQPTNDARLVWDSAQQQISSQSQQVSAGGQFPPSSVSYQSQTSYGGQSQQQRAGPHYQQSYQQNKSDDPYTYFSDVWQENKPQKMPTACSPGKQYTQSENSYSRDANYSVDKYKSDSQWEPKDYPEVAVGERSSRFHYQATRGGLRPERSDFQDRVACHPSYREREASMKSSSSSRSDHLPKGRPPLPSGGSSYRDDVYEQKPGVVARPPTGPGPRGVQQRLPPKRASDPTDRPLRDLSPKRMKPTNRNLQEVRTVDNLNDPSAFEKKEEDSDPEMQEYRKKMEEQKRLREKILREKENRRKLAAMEKQNEEAKSSETSGDGGQQQETRQPSSSSGLLGVVKESIRGQATIGRGRARPTNAHTTEGTERPGGVRIVRTIQAIPASDTTTETSVTKGGNPGGNSQLLLAENNNNNNNRTLAGQSGGVRRVVIQKPLNTQKVVATTIQKTVSNLQKGPTVGCSQTKVIASGGQPQTATLKKILPSSAQRIVTQKPSVGLQKTVINVQEPINAGTTQQKVVLVAGSGGGGGGSQNNQRVVLQKGQQKKLPEIIKTNTVKLENLAASTSEAQIRRMCQGIGTIESVHMGERSATVVFKTQSAAMVFHKKYQRKMLDLSLITVRLVPQSATGTKSSANVLKVS